MKPEFANYTRPYFNGNWQIVRWQFARVLDIYQTDIERFDPDGTEVFSQMKHRCIRPEYEWHPLQSAAVTEASSSDHLA